MMILQGRYEIVQSIKAGGMGSVYLAKDQSLADSLCAVKEIRQEVLGSEQGHYIIGRFEEEMRSLVALDHPSIPRVRDFFQLGDLRYIVMDYVAGANLEEEVDRHGPLPPERAVGDMLSVLETLQYLHAQRPAIVHRDVKPANIIRDEKAGKVRLVDFGLARKLEGGTVQTAVGTPGFCSPEQMIGRADPRSDLYSVGVTLHFLLTAIEPDLMHFEALRPELPGCKPGLAEIVEKATQLKGCDRYLTAEDMATDLKRWLARPAEGPSRSPLERGTKSRRDVAPFANVPPALADRPARVSWGRLLAVGGVASALVVGVLAGQKLAPAGTESTRVVKVVVTATASPTPTVAAATPTPRPVPKVRNRPRPAAKPAPIESPIARPSPKSQPARSHTSPTLPGAAYPQAASSPAASAGELGRRGPKLLLPAASGFVSSQSEVGQELDRDENGVRIHIDATCAMVPRLAGWRIELERESRKAPEGYHAVDRYADEHTRSCWTQTWGKDGSECMVQYRIYPGGSGQVLVTRVAGQISWLGRRPSEEEVSTWRRLVSEVRPAES